MGQSKITVRPDRVTGQLGDLYGIFFEDLNHAADGGSSWSSRNQGECRQASVE